MINFIDTADVYSAGESEVIVGKAVADGRRDDIVLASKVHMPMGEDPNQRGNSRRWIIREIENSLRRLGTDAEGPYSVARQRLANRFDMSLPENQRKLGAAGQLAELADKAGITLIEMAIAFVLRHPAITSAIIGPRIMEHLESQLTAASTVPSDDVLDRIDEIVPPGITLNPADNGWVSPALQASARRH